MIAIRKSQMHRSPNFVACICSAAIVVGAFIAALFSHAADPATPAAQPAAKTFRLADGSEIPIEQYGETYETLEWRPPIDPKKAKVIADYNYDSGFGTVSIALDLTNKRIYWFLGGGRHGTLVRANLDGSGRKKLLDELPTPDGMKEIQAVRHLNIVPEMKKILWVCQSVQPHPPGHAIYEADLDGKNPKAIVTGLHSCACLIVDPVGKKLYYNDDGIILRSNMDGTGTEELGAKAHALFAIDLKRRLIFAEDDYGISRQSFDGSGREILYQCKGLPCLGLSLVLDVSRGELYWLSPRSITRAPLDDLNRFEELIDIGPYEPPFAVDLASQRLYWINTNGNMLSAPLPSPRSPVSKASPPLITGFDRDEAATGEEITIRGSGFSECRRIFWIGDPTAKFVEGKILSLSNDAVTANVPDLGPNCTRVHVVLSGNNGTTVTMSHDTTMVRQTVLLNRTLSDKRVAFVVQSPASLHRVENRIVLLGKGTESDADVRGGNVFFVKNGGTGCVNKHPGVVFHEPHARVIACPETATRIATPAIRPSYVEQLLMIKK